jgi:hypothetical protein
VTAPQFTTVLQRSRAPRIGPGRPRSRPDRVLADKAEKLWPEFWRPTGRRRIDARDRRSLFVPNVDAIQDDVPLRVLDS